MTLTIHKEIDEQRQLRLTIEVASERVDQALRQTAKEIGKEVHLPGFRQGKAPYHIILKRFGREALLAETAEAILPSVFEEALAQIDETEIYAEPKLEKVELEPMTFQLTIPLIPQVKLSDYRTLRREVVAPVVTEEAVAEVLERIRLKHQVLETVDRPAELGDVVTLSGLGQVMAPPTETAETTSEQAQTIFAEERVDMLLDPEKLYPNTPFIEYILGLSAGEQTKFSFNFPADYEDAELAGKTATFNLSILQVQSRELPELNDELAQREGGYATVDELRTAVYHELQRAAEAEASEALVDSMTDSLLAEAEIVYPPAAVEKELDVMIATMQSRVRYSGWQWRDFLQIQGETEESLRDSLREAAVARLRRNLVMRQFVQNEKLKVKPEDIDRLVDARTARFEDEELRENMRNYYQRGAGLDLIHNDVLQDKVVERIKAIYTGVAPDLDDLEDEETDSAEEE